MSYNEAILIGRLGDNPRIISENKGREVIVFSIATNWEKKDSQGAKTTLTNWHNIKAFGKLGLIAYKYLSKGHQVLITGRINYYQYTNDEGKPVNKTEIISKEIKFLEKRDKTQ